MFNDNSLARFYNDLYSMCPLYVYGDSTIYKHGLPAIAGYLYYAINNRMGHGYFDFHYSNYFQYKRHVCKEYDNAILSLGVPQGSNYIIHPKTLHVSFTGDGGPIKNAEKGISHMCLSFLKILGYSHGVVHSLYSGICVLVSSLSESSDELQNIMQLIGSSMPTHSQLAIHCPKLNSYVCFKIHKWNAGDWKWCFQMHNLSVGCSAAFSLVEMCCWENGDVFGLNYDDCYKCLMSDYIDPWTVPCFNECKNSNFNGYCLSDCDVFDYWGDLTEIDVNIAKNTDATNGRAHLWDDPIYEHKERVKIAQKCRQRGHGIIKKNNVSTNPALLDAAHALWSFVLTIVALLVMLMYVVWGWNKSDILSVVKKFNTPTITKQVSDYMEIENTNRSVTKICKLRTDGTTNIRMFARWPFVIQYAAFVADAYESRNPNTTHAATLILVVLWVVGSEMRYVFYIFWKSKFDINKNNDRPNEITTMIRKAYRAMYISCHLGSILVCICFCCFFLCIYMYSLIKYVYVHIYKCCYTYHNK